MKKTRKRWVALLLGIGMILSTVSYQKIVANNDTINLDPVKNIVIPPVGIEISETNFPDENFRMYVSECFDNDRPKDGWLSIEELDRVWIIETKWMDHNPDQKVTSLKGIEFFGNLETLFCQNGGLTNNSNLTDLDLSFNHALTTLHCDYNPLTSLDVSKNVALKELSCVNIGLTSIDLSQNTALERLDIGDNQLTSLDVSNNLALTGLSCFRNQLTSIDVSNNLALDSFHPGQNPLTSLDVSNNTELANFWCNYLQLTELDISNNRKLIDLNCRGNQFTTLDFSNHPTLTRLQVGENPLTSLTVKNNAALQELSVDKTPMTTLDVGNNPQLYYLDIKNSKLTTLDLTQNPGLGILYAQNNNLISVHMDANANVSPFNVSNQGENTVLAGETYDLKALDGKIDSTKISNLQGATLTGTVLSDYVYDSPIAFDYTCANGAVINAQIVMQPKARNSWIQELTINDWTYGETASEPNAVAQYGEVIYQYSDTIDGTYTASNRAFTGVKPINAGTWYVKAFVEEGPTYTGLESNPVAFKINPAIPQTEKPNQEIKDPQTTVVTGDTTQVPLYVGLGIVSLFTGAFVLFKKRRKI